MCFKPADDLRLEGIECAWSLGWFACGIMIPFQPLSDRAGLKSQTGGDLMAVEFDEVGVVVDLLVLLVGNHDEGDTLKVGGGRKSPMRLGSEEKLSGGSSVRTW